MNLLAIYFNFKMQTFNKIESDWNRDMHASIVLFEGFATTGGGMILAHKAAR